MARTHSYLARIRAYCILGSVQAHLNIHRVHDDWKWRIRIMAHAFAQCLWSHLNCVCYSMETRQC